jgi:uncharacterized membrane protein
MNAPPSLPVREVEPARVAVWLTRGWQDLWRCPLPGLVHGAACTLFGALLLWWAHDDFWILAGTFSGFLIVAPVVATGLYAVSRGLERGERPGLRSVWQLWRDRDPRLVHFGVLLAFAGTGWVVTSASFVTSFADQPIHRPIQFLRYVVLQDDGWLFEVWLVLGALLAAPMFASSVVAIPLLLERRISVLRAVVTSWTAVLASPVTLALWAAVILGLTTLGMLSALLGLVVVVPWLGHASWHAYRDLVPPGD